MNAVAHPAHDAVARYRATLAARRRVNQLVLARAKSYHLLMNSVAATTDIYNEAVADDLQAMAALDEAIDEMLALKVCDA